MYLAADKYLTMEKNPTPEVKDLASLDLEDQAEIIAQALEHFCSEIEAKGMDPAILDAMLLAVFSQRMADVGDRASYEELLNSALEDEWEEHSLH